MMALDPRSALALSSRLGAGLVLAIGLGACASAPSRFYTLQSTARAGAQTARPQKLAVIVGPVSIPASVDRPELVLQVAPNRVEVDEFDRWASPLDDAIASVVAVDLAALLGSPEVATAPLANFEPTHRVTIDVQRFESNPGVEALVDAVWVVRRSAGGQTISGRTTAREPAQEAGYDALAAAHSRALGRLASDIAGAIERSGAR